jgi:chemotaxis protein MotA
MDIASVIGLIGALALIVMAMGDPGPFVDTPSMLIVVGGSIMATLYRSTLPEFIGFAKVFGKVFGGYPDKPEDLIVQLVELATIARKDGMIALEGQDIKNKFMAKAISMLVDGTDGKLIRVSLERENEQMKNRHVAGASFFSAWAEIAPAMGMIGTLVGLVLMLGNMSDPKSIGPAMAVALLTTLYGALLANVILIPCAMKLKTKSDMEALNNALIIEAVMFINEGGNPRVMGDVLGSFLDPKAREKAMAASAS